MCCAVVKHSGIFITYCSQAMMCPFFIPCSPNVTNFHSRLELVHFKLLKNGGSVALWEQTNFLVLKVIMPKVSIENLAGD